MNAKEIRKELARLNIEIGRLSGRADHYEEVLSNIDTDTPGHDEIRGCWTAADTDLGVLLAREQELLSALENAVSQ